MAARLDQADSVHGGARLPLLQKAVQEVGSRIYRIEQRDGGEDCQLYGKLVYDRKLSQKGLAALGLGNFDADKLAMDNVAMIDDLFRIGEAAARTQVDFQNHSAAFLEPGSAA